MTMADDGYITFKGVNEGVVDAFYLTQALANAAAADNADIVAHVGLLDLGGFEPNTAYFDGAQLLEEIPEAKLPSLDRKKLVLRRLHFYLRQLAEELAAEGVAHAVTETHAAHNFAAFGHHGSYLVAHDEDLTDDQIIAWAEKMLDGPTDAPSKDSDHAFQWYQRISAGALTGPTGPCTWVAPDTGTPETVGNIGSTSNNAFGVKTVTDTQLSDGKWIEELT